jgi:hypothetical protein
LIEILGVTIVCVNVQNRRSIHVLHTEAIA